MEQSAPALALMTFFILMGCGLFGTLIWFAEGGEWYPEGNSKLEMIVPPIVGRGAYLRPQAMAWTTPGAFDNANQILEETPFESIIHAFWFVVVTITTVGYGDVYPTSVAGKLIGTLMILAGVIVLAMPIGVVGANFSREYYRVVDDKKRRLLMQKQLDALAAVEAQQDAILKAEGRSSQPADAHPTAIEIHKKIQRKKQLIETAEAVDRKWSEGFSNQQYTAIANELRYWLASLFPETSRLQSEAVTDTPTVSLQTMAELDVLTAKVNAVITAHTCVKDLAGFTLSDSQKYRWHWALFVNECWQCVIDICKVDEPPGPLEFFEMKAAVAREGEGSYPQVTTVQVTSPSRRDRTITVEDTDARSADIGGVEPHPKLNLRDAASRSASSDSTVPGRAANANLVLLPNMPDA